MTTLKVREGSKCILCGREFFKTPQSQILCSALCRKSFSMARRRVRDLRSRGIGDDGKLPLKNCVVCGVEFEQRQGNYITCGAGVCKREREGRTYKTWRKDNAHLYKANPAQ